MQWKLLEKKGVSVENAVSAKKQIFREEQKNDVLNVVEIREQEKRIRRKTCIYSTPLSCKENSMFHSDGIDKSQQTID